jgi:capsular exopolysaccharide synthesis family protein
VPAPVKNKKQAIVSAKDLNLILRILRGNWWVPLIIVPFFYLIAVFYVYRLTTIYKASTEFLIKSEDAYYKNNVLSDAAFMGSSYMDNSNETRIIQSYDLTKKVVDKLIDRLQVSYYIVGKVRTTELFDGMPFHVRILSVNPAFYEKRINFAVLDRYKYSLSYEQDNLTVTKEGYFNRDTVDLDLGIRIDWVNGLPDKVPGLLDDILYQFVIHDKESLIGEIRQNMTVTNPEYTQILKVELKDVIPERAILILDTLNSVYAYNKLQSKYDLNDRTISYIDRQLGEISFSLKSLEDTMQDYKTNEDIIDLNWEQTDFLTKISKYDDERSLLQLQLNALNDLEKYIVEDKDPQFLPPTVFVTEKNGFMSKAVEQLYTQQIELNKLYSTVREGNPIINELKSSIRKTKQDLLVYITNSRKASQQQVKNLNEEIFQYIAEAKRIPGKQRDILNIQRKASVSEGLYSFLLEKKASTKIAKASIVPDVKVIEAPRYAGIDSPDKDKIRNQVVTIGAALSFLLILIRSMVFSKIKSVDHLKDLTELPLIGVLPFVKDASTEGVIVEQEPNSYIAEAFRNFRTNLQYANVDMAAKTYLVTSFLPGEGKTFTSVNLGTILAKSGKRTVLIELDLHKPRIYKRFGLSEQMKGITTCINGLNTVEEIISGTQITNLFCIYAGPIPPNPSEYVLSEKMKEIIQYAKENFDFVIIDSPPAGLLSDSVYLIQYVDASVFVLNTRSSTKKVITFLEDLMEANSLKNVLLLLNGVERAKRRYYYSGYGYNYGYGYGYGYGKGQSYRK